MTVMGMAGSTKHLDRIVEHLGRFHEVLAIFEALEDRDLTISPYSTTARHIRRLDEERSKPTSYCESGICQTSQSSSITSEVGRCEAQPTADRPNAWRCRQADSAWSGRCLTTEPAQDRPQALAALD